VLKIESSFVFDGISTKRLAEPIVNYMRRFYYTVCSCSWFFALYNDCVNSFLTA
jgi:hypothetical protein